MPTREIDETEFLDNQRLKDTVAKLMANPKSAVLVEQALKEVDPNAKTPRLDARKNQDEAVEAVTKKFDDLKKELAERAAKEDEEKRLAKLNSDWESGRSKLRSKGVTEEGLKGCEELMQKHGIIDHEIGWAAFEKLNPPPPPATPTGSNNWNLFEMPKEDNAPMKQLIESHGDSEQALQSLIGEALADVRGTPRR